MKGGGRRGDAVRCVPVGCTAQAVQLAGPGDIVIAGATRHPSPPPHLGHTYLGHHQSERLPHLG